MKEFCKQQVSWISVYLKGMVEEGGEAFVLRFRQFSKGTGRSIVNPAWGVSSCWLKRIRQPCSYSVACRFSWFQWAEGCGSEGWWCTLNSLEWCLHEAKPSCLGCFLLSPRDTWLALLWFGPLHRLLHTSTQHFCIPVAFWWFDHCSIIKTKYSWDPRKLILQDL